MMSSPPGMNPYAPSGDTADGAAAKLAMSPRSGRVSTVQVALGTVAACTCAGALFGFSVLVFAAAASLLASGGNASGFEMGDMVTFGAGGVIVGGILALLSSIPTVLFVCLVGKPLRGPDHQWDGRGVGRFAAISGLIAGFCPIPVVSQFEISGILFGIVPAIFGAIVARLLIIPLSRKAGRHREPLSSEPPANYPAG